jgi:hypothetical protein
MRVAEFVRRVRAEGWRVATRPGGHLELSHPLADRVIIRSRDAGDHRWLANPQKMKQLSQYSSAAHGAFSEMPGLPYPRA